MANGTSSISNLAWMSGAGAFLQVYGLFEAGRGARLQGQREREAYEFMAFQAEEQAGQAIAAAQRRAFEERRQATLAQSRSLAVAAASGGGASDVTVVNLIAGLAGEGAYRAAVAMFEGASRARQLRLEAAAGRLSGASAEAVGRQRRTAYNIRAIGTGIRSGVSLYERYGNGGPSGDSELIDEEP